jgi:hypothetical protein
MIQWKFWIVLGSYLGRQCLWVCNNENYLTDIWGSQNCDCEVPVMWCQDPPIKVDNTTSWQMIILILSCTCPVWILSGTRTIRTEICCVLFHSVPTDARIAHLVRPLLLHSTFFPAYYLLSSNNLILIFLNYQQHCFIN